MRLRVLRACSAIAIFATLSCSDADGPSSASVVERRIAPSAANPAIVNYTADNFIWLDPSQSSKHLVVFLAGTQGVPQVHTLLGPVVAALGYRVIGLTYPNDYSPIFACAVDPDPDCMEKLRAETQDGVAVSPEVAVDAANSITGRLTSLLTLLHSQYPAEGWNYFLDGDKPNWSRITAAGHSQGGGQAAYIAKTRLVERVVMFGAPADGFNGSPAPWMQIGMTPVEKYYGFRHVRDVFLSITPNWFALGLDRFGPAVTIGAQTTDFHGAHMFLTDLLPSTGTYSDAHSSVSSDGSTPLRADGTPVYDNIWRYLFGRP